MTESTKYGGRYPYKRVWCGLCVYILFCSFLMAACGQPASPKETLTGSDTPTDEASNSTVTSSAHVLPIQVVTAQTNITTYPGGQMNMTISTSPYAVCSFIVNYGRATPSSNIGVVSHTANANGVVSWTWHVDGDAHTGSWPLTVSATLPNGSKTSAQVNVVVTLPPINVVAAQSNLSAAPKGNMNLTITTAPGVDASLTLNYGPTRLQKHLPARSNFNGVASWTWRVDDTAPAGVWPQTITVTLADGESTSSQVNMTVV